MAVHYYSTHNHIEPELEEVYVQKEAYSGPERIIWSLFFVVLAFLLFRFGFKLLGANPATPFVAFVYGVSGLFMAPFEYIVPIVRSGRSILEWPTLIAALVYLVIAWMVARLIRLGRPTDYVGDNNLRHKEAF